MAKQVDDLSNLYASALAKAEAQFDAERRGLKAKATRQSANFDDEVFKSWEIGRRLWMVLHKGTNRLFQVKGHNNIHQFWADEVVKVKGNLRLQPTIVKSDQSKKECLLLLEKFCLLVQKDIIKQAPKPVYVRPEVQMPLYAESPVKHERLLVKAIHDTRFVYKDSADRKYIIERQGKYWTCACVNNHQPIAVNVDSHEIALAELTNYLDSNPFNPIPNGQEVAIVVEKRADGLYTLITAMVSNNEVLYASVEDDETLDAAVEFEKALMSKQSYKWKLKLRDKIQLRGRKREFSNTEEGDGERIIAEG